MRRYLASIIPSCVLLPAAILRGQAFDCIELNDENTNLFVPPDACIAPPVNGAWCDCVRSVFTNPVRGQKSGFQQAVMWVIGEPGIGNHRVEVTAGTLDLSGLKAGDLLGEVLAHELIPGSFPFVGGEFFTVKIEIRATAAAAGSADFRAAVTDTTPGVRLALGYDPADEAHSSGHVYDGRIVSGGPGRGFTLEYRYAKDLIQENPERRPGIDANEVGSPTFTIPLLFRFFSGAPGIYALPDAGGIDVTTTLRRFTESALEEVLDLGAGDLCAEVADPQPCKVLFESFELPESPPANRKPSAVITALDGLALTVLPPPIEIQTFCGRARVLLRGRNSRDGDGDYQPLLHEWFVKAGPEGGAAIPEHTARFKDTQVFFSRPGDYEIGLRVNDGGEVNGTEETSVQIRVRSDTDSNVPPTAVIATRPDPPEVQLAGGEATITLDGSGSSNGRPAEDDCGQQLSFRWRQLAGPPGAEAQVLSPDAETTEVRFSAAGSYAIELEVDDGALENHADAAAVQVTVQGEALEPRFRRGDADADGRLNLTDAVRTLNWLFLGSAEPACLDAADADDSGAVNITDPIQVLQFLFLGGAAPPPPGPFECGRDAAADGLAACAYEKC